MARLLLFATVLAATLAAVAIVNWRTDLEGEFYDRSVLTAAAREGCLVSDELVGTVSHFPFKLDLFAAQPHTRIVIGSSRVLKIASHPGEKGFANLGFPGMTPDALLRLVRRLPEGPMTLYLGVEVFWFNPSFPVRPFGPTIRSRFGYLVNGSSFTASVRMLREAPSLAKDPWRTLQVGGRCILGRTSPGRAWRLDGSRIYSFELEPTDPRPPVLPYTDDLERLRAGLYADWRGRFDQRRLRLLNDVLDLATRRGWQVVGFAPPDGGRYVRLFTSHPSSRGPWRTYWREIPQAFRRRGFPFLDFHTVEAIPCLEAAFVDDGYHLDAPCSVKLRHRLDSAARR